MKKLHRDAFLLIISLTLPGIAPAHPGHVTNEQVHGFLHVEHLLALIAIVIVLFIGKVLKKYF